MEEESPTRHHPHHLSSLVVRPTDSGGGGSDYEPGEVRRDPPPHSRPDRYNDSSGHVGRADSVSPLRYRNVDSRYRPNFNNSDGPHTTRSDSVSPRQHDRYRPDFNHSNGTQMTRSNSVSPLHHDRYRPDFNNSNGSHMARSDSASPVSHKAEDRYRTNFNNGSHMARSDSASPVHHDRYRPNFNNSSGPRKTRSDSASPFRRGKVDDRYKPDYNNTSGDPHEGSDSPFGHRNADDRYRPDFDAPTSPHVMRPNSVSPLRHRRPDNRHRPEFVNLRGPQRGRGFMGGRGPGSRFRDFSPPYGRARGGGRPYGFIHVPPRNDGMLRPFPNVSPREGDWMCPDPLCGNLNFARRHICNKCHKSRFGPGVGPRRNYPGPPRFNGPAFGRSLVPPRFNGPPFDRSPPRGDWGRGGGPREFNTGPPHFRQGGRFPREIQDYPEEEFDERERFGRSVPPEWGPRDRDFNGRRGFESRNERRSLSPLPLPPPPPPLPPPPPSRDRWRERSRSPIMMNGPPKDHPQDSFMGRGRGRGGRWGMARDRGRY